MHGGGKNIDVVFTQDTSDIGEQTRAVECLDLNVDEEHRPLRRGPLHVDHALGLARQVSDVRAVGLMNTDPRSAGDKPENFVAGDRSATFGELDQDVRSASHEDTRFAGSARPTLPQLKRFRLIIDGGVLLSPGEQLLNDRLGRHSTLTNCLVEGFDVLKMQKCYQLSECFRRHQTLQRKVLFPHGSSNRFLALLNGLIAAFLGKPLANL